MIDISEVWAALREAQREIERLKEENERLLQALADRQKEGERNFIASAITAGRRS